MRAFIYFDADMPGEAVRKERIEKSGGAAQNAPGCGEQKLGPYQPPEMIR